MESTLKDYNSPQKSFCRQHLATLATLTISRPASFKFPDRASELFCKQLPVFVNNRLPHLLFCGLLVPNFPKELFCKQSPLFVNNRRFTEFFDRYFHIPLPIVTKHECIIFGANPSTIFLVIVVTDRQTDIHTNQRR